MFFIFGCGSQTKMLSTQQGICKHCGHMCQLQVFMTYSYFSLFFIPLFQWNKQYFVRSSGCGAVYSIPSDIGKSLAKGDISSIPEEALSYVIGSAPPVDAYCGTCGAPRENNTFCTKCGTKF